MTPTPTLTSCSVPLNNPCIMEPCMRATSGHSCCHCPEKRPEFFFGIAKAGACNGWHRCFHAGDERPAALVRPLPRAPASPLPLGLRDGCPAPLSGWFEKGRVHARTLQVSGRAVEPEARVLLMGSERNQWRLAERKAMEQSEGHTPPMSKH